MTNSLTQLPDGFRRIHLQLARETGHPAGDPEENYIIVAPLGDDGRIDPEAWGLNREACRVVRNHRGETAVGHLVHGPGGHWWFEYDVAGAAESERGFRLEDERVQEGEYISIVRGDGEHPFRVIAVGRV